VITFCFIHSSYAEESKQPSSKVGKSQIKNAIWVPGKVGYVFNPYTHNILDVRGLPLGSLVRDPMDSEMLLFRIPRTAAAKPNVSKAITTVQNLVDTVYEMDTLEENQAERVRKAILKAMKSRKKEAGSLLLKALKKAKGNPKKQRNIIWALGFAENKNATNEIIQIVSNTKDKKLRQSGLGALGMLGTESAGKYLFKTLEETKGKDERMTLFMLLARMQYPPVADIATELLKQDPSSNSWQPMMVYGQLGDVGIPVLLKKVNSEDKNERINAIYILSNWLMSLEAAPVLKKRYSKESDPKIKMLILQQIVNVSSDIASVIRFHQSILKSESDAQLKALSADTLAHKSSILDAVAAFKKNKVDDAKKFQKYYQLAYDNYGLNVEWKILSSCSKSSDNEKLKKLRERIFQRGSDESFYDCEALNHIILLNRFIEKK